MATPLLSPAVADTVEAAGPGVRAVPGRSIAGMAFGLAAAFGLLTGLAESALLAYVRYGQHHLTHVSPQAVWLGPLAYTLIFALPAAACAVLGLRRPGGWWLGVLAGTLAFLSAYSVLQLLTGLKLNLHVLARLALSAGIALRVGTWVRRGEPTVRRRLPRLVLVMGGIVFVLGAGYNVLRAVQERRALAALPAARAGAPNILLLIWDTVRASSLGLYGYGRPTTPQLERLAARGTTFDMALSSAPWSLDSHATIFTGRWPHELSTEWRTGLDRRPPVLAEVLARDGYVTAGFVANTYYGSVENGLARGMVHYEDYRLGIGEFIASTALGRLFAYNERVRVAVGRPDMPGRKHADEIDARFLRWLDRRSPDRPFFAFLNLFDAHTPYLPPEPWASDFRTTRPRRVPMIWEGRKLPPEGVRAERDAYDASIAYLDARLGVLVQELRNRGLLENTIMVVTSDHGEEFGEHGVFTHGNTLYLPSLHVPLVLVAPGSVPAGRRVAQPVSLRDVAATILDLAGVANPHLPGSSLSRFWRAAELPEPEPLLAELDYATGLPPTYPVSSGNMSSWFAGGFQLIVGGHGGAELYDLVRDRAQARNLLANLKRPRPGSN